VILPLIEDSEKMNLSSAKKTFKHLSEDVFINKKVGLLHGKLNSHEKNAVINSFLKNEINKNKSIFKIWMNQIILFLLLLQSLRLQ